MDMPKKGETKHTEPERTRARPADERRDLFRMWTDGYTTMTKMWEESYANLYNPWVESAGKLFDRAVDLAKEQTPDKYKDFYEELNKLQQNTVAKFYAPRAAGDKQTLERLAESAKRSSDMMRSWSDELNDNAKRTRDILASGARPEDYREFYEMWTRSYEKMFDQMMGMMTSEESQEVFEAYTGMPSAYMKNIAEMSKLWRESWKELYSPIMDSMVKLSQKAAQLSRGTNDPDAYRDFYDQWMNTYKEAYSRLWNFQLDGPSKNAVETMLRSTDSAMNIYKSWVAALEKMQSKMRDVMTRSTDPNVYKEFYELWVTTYEKAFDDLFEHMPMLEEMRPIMEPMKRVARMQLEAYNNMSKLWIDAISGAPWARETKGAKSST